MGVTKNDSTMKVEADQAQRKNLEVEIQQDKNEKNSTAGKKSNGKDTGTYKERLKEITAVLHKHAITRGVSPEKLRLILTDLGPTFIKLGQIMSMRSDILPKRYCDELMKLCSDVDPMPFTEVEEVLREAFGCPWQEEFQEIQEKPLGSASIAQVHRAVLKTGEEVVIKVQRKGIYEIMARDIGLMKKAGSLAIGGENAYDAARTHKARLMVLAQNAGDNTMGQAQAVAKQYQVPHITLPCSKEELGGALGMRECAAFAVTDTGFALSLCRKCQMEETAQALSERLAREKKRKQKKIDRAQGKGAGSHRRKGGI